MLIFFQRYHNYVQLTLTFDLSELMAAEMRASSLWEQAAPSHHRSIYSASGSF